MNTDLIHAKINSLLFESANRGYRLHLQIIHYHVSEKAAFDISCHTRAGIYGLWFINVNYLRRHDVIALWTLLVRIFSHIKVGSNRSTTRTVRLTDIAKDIARAPLISFLLWKTLLDKLLITITTILLSEHM